MYALYREIHPPTAVEHCVSCSFLRGSSGGERNLVTASASYLRVYKLKKVPSAGLDTALVALELVVCVSAQLRRSCSMQHVVVSQSLSDHQFCGVDVCMYDRIRIGELICFRAPEQVFFYSIFYTGKEEWRSCR